MLAETGSLPPPTALTLADDADLADDAHVALGHDAAVKTEQRCADLERAVAVLEQRASIAARMTRRLRPSDRVSIG